MELAGPITLSPQDQTAIVVTVAVVFVAATAALAAFFGMIVGLGRTPRSPWSSAARFGAVGVVVGVILLGFTAFRLRAGEDRALPEPPPTTIFQLVTPPELATCDATEWATRVRTQYSPHSAIESLRCNADYAVTDVQTGTEDFNLPRTARVFWKLDAGNWKNFGPYAGNGCSLIASTEPSFPTELCADLPDAQFPFVTTVATR